jgi:flagellar motor component MotA
VETYAKTLGKVAVGTVVVGVGVIALVAIAEGGGAGLIDLGGGIGGSLTNEKKEKNPLLLCNKCFQENQDIKENKIIAKKKKTKLEAQKKDILSLEKDIEKTVQLEEEILSDGYCSHIDILNGKKCGRIEFRKTGLCYVHK